MRCPLLPFCLLLSLPSVAQQNLAGSRTGSALTYVYKLTADEAKTLYRKGLHNLPHNYLHTLADSFAVTEPVLPSGNYLFVHAIRNRVVYTLHAAGDLDFKAVNNHRDLAVALHNKGGMIITNAQVWLNNKPLRYDAATQTFRKSKHKRGGQLLVRHRDIWHPFAVEPQPTYKPRRSFWQKIVGRFPLTYVARLFRKDRRRDNFQWGTAYERDYRGFLVTDKPMYKPGDTVRLKAFVTTKNGRPVNQALNLRLSSRDFAVDTVLASVTPYRAGGYVYSFVVNDSLDMDLDEEYLFTLEKPGKAIHLSDDDGDKDEEELAAKRKVVMRGRFRYEEYELKSVTFSARSNKEVHHRGEERALFLKASDENGMAVMDGRIQVVVTSQPYGAKTFDAPRVFLPDTLWQYEGPLDAVGETKVALPDSVFPQASFGYNAECVFLNTNNERQTRQLSLRFNNAPDWVSSSEEGDSLKLFYFRKGSAAPLAATLYGLNDDDDTVDARTVNLPATVAVHPFAKTYTVAAPGIEEEHKLKDLPRLVSALAFRTRDSVYVRLLNPQRLPVWYTVFAGNKIVEQGLGDSLFYAAKSGTPKNYFVSLQYIFNDKVQSEDYTVPYRDKILALTVIGPEAVYPGQRTTATVTVKNAADNPVEGADVTAWAFTKKFPNYWGPSVPYFGKFYPGRKRYANFNEDEAEFNGSERLVWERWSRQLHLDTVEYYKFLRPQTLYVNTQPAPDSLTQVAPFVTLNGELQPVHHIYLDEVPLFFSAAQHLQRYSFAVSPGRHNLKLRTHNKLLTLDSFVVERGVKTVVSINADVTNNRITVKPVPDTLTPYEKGLWSKYTLLMEANFGERYAYINNGNAVFLLNGGGYQSTILTGPFPHRFAQLNVKNGFTQSFEPEGGYLYRITEGLIKQKQLPSPHPFFGRLSSGAPAENFGHYVLTEGEVDSLWQRYLYNRSASEDLFSNPHLAPKGAGQLQIGLPKDGNARLNGAVGQGTEPFIRNLFLFRYDDADFLRVYRGEARSLGYLLPGNYRLLLLLPGDTYIIKDSIVIKKDGINYYGIERTVPKERDSVSIRISEIISAREKSWLYSGNTEDFQGIKETFNQQYLDASFFTETVTGAVRDEKGRPVIGATVRLKGTRVVTVTDRFGRYTLPTPPNAVLVVSSVGYESREVRAGSDEVVFNLLMAKRSLNEVVVVGYGTTRRSDVTGSINALEGRAAGIRLQALGKPGADDAVRIRGAYSIDGNATPLIIVDGVLFDGTVADLDPSLIAATSVLKPDAAKALYGDKGINGVVLITTKKTGANDALNDGAQSGNTLRRRFRDNGYWQPRLTTNAQGQASFTVTWPDDITAWRTFAVAVTGNKQSGSTEGVVKSFKPISANMAAPAFAVEGDTLNVIGKALNYGTDSLQLQRSFSVNDALRKESSIAFRNAWVDTFAVVSGVDSLRLKYTVANTTGYFDGEERTVPVFKKGVLQTDGFFAALRGDTAFTVQPLADSGTVTVYAESSVLPVLEREVEALHRYEYLCNEQLASKLKGWLVQKRIDGFLKRPFTGEKHIKEIIGKLSQSKAPSGLWGWWQSTAPQVWVSLHVSEALLQAEGEGYKIALDKRALTDYLLFHIDSYSRTEALQAIPLLQLLGAKADYKTYTDSLHRHLPNMNLYEKLRLAEAKQKAGLDFSIDSLLPKQNATMMGNVYWGEEGYRFFDNAIQNSLLVYRLLKVKGGHEPTLEKLRGYFLERRRKGSWGNTYESSLVLETLLPDLLVNDSLPAAPSLTVNATVINRFPYRTTLPASQAVNVTKSGRLPVYFTTYHQRWNPQPAAVASDFAVRTWFEKAGDTVTQLKAGRPIELKVSVTASADGEYVMVEVPVPAGCSYENKRQSWASYEVHREHFKNKVSIFCSRLPKGVHLFTVQLLPRYTGNYNLNPARAELMYFPAFYGREGMKKVKVG